MYWKGYNKYRATQNVERPYLRYIFTAFNPTKRREVNAKDITCGFSVLCGGSKSDKFEFAFELLDNSNRGFFT